MLITPATDNDIPALNILVNSAYRGEVATQGWTHEAHLLDGLRTDIENLKRMIRKKHAVILKCCNDDGVIEGCVYLEKKAATLHLGMLTVTPKLQSFGMGKLLLRASEDYAAHHMCNVIEITVISVRHELIQWYERQGYNKTGDTKAFPADERFGIPKQPLKFLVMTKQLS